MNDNWGRPVPRGSQCPDDDLLRQVCLGNAPPSLTEEVLAHVETCPLCPVRMDDFWAAETNAPNSFLNLVRRARTSTLPVPVPTPTPTPGTPSRGLNFLKARADSVLYDLTFLPPSPNSNCLGRIGNYDLLQILGSGGMGIVFKAWDHTDNQNVALKTLKGGRTNNPSLIKRFLNEAKATRSIRHPGILPVLDSGKDHGIPFYVMPLLSGCNFHQLIHSQAPMVPGIVVDYIRQALESLQAAHRMGILHRDIKPSNLWLKTEPAGNGKVFLLDFGLAMVDDLADPMTASGTTLGTPAYFSPEQALGKRQEMTPASDLFSIGCVLYEMLTGKRVFPGENTLEVLGNMVRHQIKPPRKINRNVPLPLNDLVMALLAKSPQKRPQSVEKVLEALRSPGLLRDPILTRRQMLGVAAAVGGTVGVVSLALWKYHTRFNIPSLEPNRSYNLNGSVSFDFNKLVPLNEEPRKIYGIDAIGGLWELNPGNGASVKLDQMGLVPFSLRTGMTSVLASDTAGNTQFHNLSTRQTFPGQKNEEQSATEVGSSAKTQILWTGNFDRFIWAHGNSLHLLNQKGDEIEKLVYKQRISENTAISSLFVNPQSTDPFRPFAATLNHGWVATFGLPDIQIYDRLVLAQGTDFRMCTNSTGVALWTTEGELIFQSQINDSVPKGKVVVQEMEGPNGQRCPLKPERILFGPKGEILVLHGFAGGRGHVLLVSQTHGRVMATLNVDDPVEIQLLESDLWVLDRSGTLHRFDRIEGFANGLA